MQIIRNNKQKNWIWNDAERIVRRGTVATKIYLGDEGHYWRENHIMCGSHHEDRFYIVDDFGNFICIEYIYKNYSSEVRKRNDQVFRNTR